MPGSLSQPLTKAQLQCTLIVVSCSVTTITTQNMSCTPQQPPHVKPHDHVLDGTNIPALEHLATTRLMVTAGSQVPIAGS